MKYLKMLVIAVVMLFAFASARAQIIVRARIGEPAHRHYYHHYGHYDRWHHPYYHRHYYWRHGHRYWHRY